MRFVKFLMVYMVVLSFCGCEPMPEASPEAKVAIALDEAARAKGFAKKAVHFAELAEKAASEVLAKIEVKKSEK
jgi:hypothetical protein